MNYDGHFTRLSSDECRQLVRARGVGRVGWHSSDGLQILPVTYSVSGERIAFRTRPDTIMGEFIQPLEVIFQIDDIDEDTATGWSVLVRGRAFGYLEQVPDGLALPEPWAPGQHPLIVVIEPTEYSGRAVSATTSGGV
ncbi:MAG TPA: pyridoxamine 5'-phosphate oxidase family protein [Propionicimonas sp.]|nr:pyridoxamine 5'-phosphate oxidase family protein [Propionicimonas sp.]